MKWIDIINRLINNVEVDRNSIIIMIDLCRLMNMITLSDSTELLSKMGVTTFDVSEIIDSILLIYNQESNLDYITIKLALRKYVRSGIITNQKMNELLSQITIK